MSRSEGVVIVEILLYQLDFFDRYLFEAQQTLPGPDMGLHLCDCIALFSCHMQLHAKRTGFGPN